MQGPGEGEQEPQRRWVQGGPAPRARGAPAVSAEQGGLRRGKPRGPAAGGRGQQERQAADARQGTHESRSRGAGRALPAPATPGRLGCPLGRLRREHPASISPACS